MRTRVDLSLRGVLLFRNASRLSIRRGTLTALASAALLAAGAPLAHAETVSFTLPGNYSFTVPAGVTSIEVSAQGAPGGSIGGSGCTGELGGRGALVSATLAVTPREQLLVGVGRPGGFSICDQPPATGGSNGGGPIPGGGGDGGSASLGSPTRPGAGGGGASVIVPASAPGSPLIVAAGGGGAGGSTGSVGTGGDAGSAGTDAPFDGGGGGAGSANMGGSAGTPGGCFGVTAGQMGSLATGGAGGSGGSCGKAGGGGGGGGYYGGGGGGGGLDNGGGGGGGSSFVAQGTLSATPTSPAVTVSVSISYTAAASPPAEDPKCKRLRKKHKLQNAGLARAISEAKQSFIATNIKDTKKRLKKLGCK